MEKLAKQLTVRYAFLQSTFWISQCAIYSFAAVYLHWKNFDNTQIGLVMALASILSIIIQPLVASFADKTKVVSLRYIVLALMVLVFGFGFTLYIMPDSFYLVAGVYVLINAIQFTLNPLFNSLALEYLNKGIPMNYGLARGMGSISFALMSYLLGFFVSRMGPGILLPIFLFCYCFVILAVILFKLSLSASIVGASNTLTSIPQQSQTPENQAEDKTPTTIFNFFIKYKKFTFLLIGISMIFYSHSLINTYLINIMEQVGGNSSDMGISLSIAAALELPTMAVFIFLVRKVKCSKLLIISAFFFLLKALLAFLAPNVLTIHISQICQMFGFALFTPASIYYVNEIIKEQDKIKGQSMLGVASLGIAGTIASVTGGKLLDTLGVSSMLLLGTIVTGFGFIIICFSTENKKSL